MASELFKLMGEISITSNGALAAINEVLSAAKGLYNYINNNGGTIHVKNDTASTINKVLQEVEQLRKQIDNGKGTIKVEGTTALSVISGVSTAVTGVYSLINTSTGVVNVDTTTATQKIEKLIELAGTVAGHLPGGTTGSTTGNTTTGYLPGGNTGGTTGGNTGGTFGYTGNSTGTGTSVGQTVAKSLSSLDIMVGNLMTKGVLDGINAVQSFFQTGFEFNQQIEVWTNTFKTLMYGDAEAAEDFMAKIREFAVTTPLSLAGTVDTVRQLMANGVAPEDALWTMQMLGDIAMGDTAKMQGLAKALTDVKNLGELKSQEKIQFANRDVDLYDALLKYYNSDEYISYDAVGNPYKKTYTRDMLGELQRGGAISYQDVISALLMTVQEDGRYFEAMDNIMDTEYGEAQKLMDNYQQAAGAFTAAIFEIFKSDTISALNGILDKLNAWATTNPDALNKLATSFSNLATNGISALTESLMGLIVFYNSHSQELNLLLSLVGTLLMFNGHAGLGLGLVALALGGTSANAQFEIEKDLNGEGKYNVTQYVLSPEGQKILAAGGSKNDLSEEDQQRYEMLEATYGSFDRIEGFLKLLGDSSGVTSGGSGMITGLMGFIDTVLADTKWNASTYFEAQVDAAKEALNNPNQKIDPKTIWEALVNKFFPSKTEPEEEDEDKGGTSGSLNRLRENMHNLDQLYASTGGMPDRSSGDTAELLGRATALTTGGMGGAMGMMGLIASVQSLTAAVQSMTGEIPSAIASGVGNISVTGHVTTGNVMLDSGAVVGQIAPSLNLVLGGLNAMSGRG